MWLFRDRELFPDDPVPQDANFFYFQPALNYGYAHPDPKASWQQPIDAPGPRAVRAEHFARYRAGNLPALTVVHPSAVVSPTATIGAGTLIMPGVIVNAMAMVGEDAILNTGCVVEHDVVIGDHALIGDLVELDVVLCKFLDDGGGGFLPR